MMARKASRTTRRARMTPMLTPPPAAALEGLAEHRVGPDRALPPDRNVQPAQLSEGERAVRESAGAVAHDDLIRSGEAKEPGGYARRLPRRRVGGPEVSADDPQHDGTGVNAHADAELESVLTAHRLTEWIELLLDRQGSSERTTRVILQPCHHAEESHDPVAEELVDRAVVGVDRVLDDLEGRVHDRADLLRVQTLGHRRKARNVHEENADLPSLAPRAERCAALTTEPPGRGVLVGAARTARPDVRAGVERGARTLWREQSHRHIVSPFERRVSAPPLSLARRSQCPCQSQRSEKQGLCRNAHPGLLPCGGGVDALRPTTPSRTDSPHPPATRRNTSPRRSSPPRAPWRGNARASPSCFRMCPGLRRCQSASTPRKSTRSWTAPSR